ncbi:MAG: hypothetical protein ACLTDC_09935 [Lachnospiraceae bacterium]
MSWIVKLTYLIVPGEDNDVEDEYEMKYIAMATDSHRRRLFRRSAVRLYYMG